LNAAEETRTNSHLRQTAAYHPSRFAYSRAAAAATFAAATSSGCGETARPGSEVNTTQIVSVAGSAQAIVPVEPP
jgi:hypothetical protein